MVQAMTCRLGAVPWRSQGNVRKGDHVTLQLCLPNHEDSTAPLMIEIDAVIRWGHQTQVGFGIHEPAQWGSPANSPVCENLSNDQPLLVSLIVVRNP